MEIEIPDNLLSYQKNSRFYPFLPKGSWDPYFIHISEILTSNKYENQFDRIEHFLIYLNGKSENQTFFPHKQPWTDRTKEALHKDQWS